MGNKQVRCKDIYENLEKNLDILRKCSKDDSIVRRVQYFIEFCKKYDIDYGLVSEGAIRPLIVKENRKQDITKEVEGLQKILAGQEQTKENLIKNAEETCDIYKKLEKHRKLTKAENREYNDARKITQTKQVPNIDKITRKQVQNYLKTVAKPMPIGTETLTLVLTKNQYNDLNAYLNEGKEAISKKALAEEIVSFLFQAISRIEVNRGV